MNKRKREREILHNYLEVLAKEYENIEPTEMADSMCKVYDSLNRSVNFVKPCFFALSFILFFNFVTCIFIFIVYFFGR